MFAAVVLMLARHALPVAPVQMRYQNQTLAVPDFATTALARLQGALTKQTHFFEVVTIRRSVLYTYRWPFAPPCVLALSVVGVRQ